MKEAKLIGVDWGLSNLRAFLYDAHGRVMAEKRAPLGVGGMAEGGFEEALVSVIRDWPRAQRLILCGMVGSRKGWAEAPYVECPAGAQSIAAAMIEVPSQLGPVLIAPGLSATSADRLQEIMRGEETQIVGALADAQPNFIIAPGTHSKWTRIDNSAVSSIRTYMTGEVYATLKTHSILAQLMDGDTHDAPAFTLGVRRALASPALLNLLFSVRAEGLFARIPAHALAAYLSGILIGSEIANGLAHHEFARHTPILVIGAREIVDLYMTALHLAGVNEVSSRDGADAAARGLWTLAQAKPAA
jgi:2-dehydro-3-deoxygalactonokinase